MRRGALQCLDGRYPHPAVGVSLSGAAIPTACRRYRILCVPGTCVRRTGQWLDGAGGPRLHAAHRLSAAGPSKLRDVSRAWRVAVVAPKGDASTAAAGGGGAAAAASVRNEQLLAAQRCLICLLVIETD